MLPCVHHCSFPLVPHWEVSVHPLSIFCGLYKNRRLATHSETMSCRHNHHLPNVFWSPPTTKPATFSSHHHQGALKANQISRSQLRATLISNGNKEQGAWKRTKVKTSNFNPGVVTSRTGPESWWGCWLRHGLGEYYRNFLNFSVYYYGVLRFKSRKLVTNPNPRKKYSNLK